MAFCSKCGTELTEGAKFCPECGESVKPTVEKSKKTVDAIKKSRNKADNKKEDENDWKYGCGLLIVIALIIGFFAIKCSGDGSDNKATKTEQRQESPAKKKSETSKYVGDYYYSFFISNTNASLYFKITLKSDGTFTHTPSNENTKNYIDLETMVDGKSYPSGGTWSASSDGISLDFNGSWSGGRISADMKRLEIYNMNGYDLKTSISR